MKDRLLLYAILISLVINLAAVAIVGHTSGHGMNAASVLSLPQKLIRVDFVRNPKDAVKPIPKPEPKPESAAMPHQVNIHNLSRIPISSQNAPMPTAANSIRKLNHFTGPVHSVGTGSHGKTAPGGALNMGTPSANGDISGLPSGRTPSGWVPGSDRGTGIGYGSAPGVGRAEPPKHNIEEPHTSAPQPAPAPEPKRISVRVCSVSGLIPGEYCKHTRMESFIEGEQPRRTCDKCKPPEPEHHSRLADRENPILTHDVKPSIPDSVDEGLTLTVEIEYHVDADGGVSDIKVIRSSGSRDLDRSVVNAATRWKYNPAIQDGVARRVKVKRSITFRT